MGQCMLGAIAFPFVAVVSIPFVIGHVIAEQFDNNSKDPEGLKGESDVVELG